MTNYAELIAEAERFSNSWNPMDGTYPFDLVDRLAAAVRKLAPPEGWRVTEWMRDDLASVNQAGPDWGAFSPNGQMVAVATTASAAMAALDGENE